MKANFRASVQVKPAAGLNGTLKACGDENGFLVYFDTLTENNRCLQNDPTSLSEALDGVTRLCRTLTNCGFEVLQVEVL